MGTPMAVNFANLFMDSFESEMLNAYKREHGSRPKLWLQFIDDVLFVWRGDESSLNNFIQFCNNFSSSSNMKRTIKITSSYSRKEVNFLDVSVRIENGHLSTDLFYKPVDTHTYLHAFSFHPPSTVSSLPRAQFIHI